MTTLLAVLCIVGWRVFWLTITNRPMSDALAEVALTKADVEIVDCLAGDASQPTMAAVRTTSSRSQSCAAT